MRLSAAISCVLCLLAGSTSCRNSRGELVEAELRTKDAELLETRSELERARLINEALERELINRQTGRSTAVGNTSLLSPKDITLGNGTGGVDDDRLPGDEMVQVVVVPRDEDGNPVRALGSLNISAVEITPSGVKTPLSTWDVSTIELRKTWRGGLLGSGYHVVLPWKKLPTCEKLRITAQLRLPDGRVYEADKDISIRPIKAPSIPEKLPVNPPIPPASGAEPALPCPAASLLEPQPWIDKNDL